MTSASQDPLGVKAVVAAASLRIVALDFDSTVSGVEGLDVIATWRGADTATAVADLTRQAMDGEVPMQASLGQRLDMLRPSEQDCARLAAEYRTKLDPTAATTIAALKVRGFDVVIVSGGLADAIRPVASELGVTTVVAVELFYASDGSYAGFSDQSPTTRAGGKAKVLQALRGAACKRAGVQPDDVCVIMVGDGATDAEAVTEPPGAFVAYTGFVRREAIVASAACEVSQLSELLPLLG